MNCYFNKQYYILQQTRLMELARLAADCHKDNTETLNEVFADLRKLAVFNQNLENSSKKHSDVLKKLKNIFEDKENIDLDPTEVFREQFDSAIDYSDNNFVDQIDNLISESTNEDNSCDVSMVISEVPQIHLDPWTKIPIKVPVRSMICNHVYDSESIKEKFKCSTMQCPYMGCKTVLTKEHLIYPDA